MARIGIMSMQRVANYGSFLQAFALRKILEGYGHHVEFVDYRNRDGSSSNSVLPKLGIRYKARILLSKTIRISGLSKVSKRLRRLSNAIECQDLFQHRFYEEFIPMLGVDSIRNERPNLDLLVIGSDEVFNIQHRSLDLFGEGNKAKHLISFAGSFGDTTIQQIEETGLERKLGELFAKFDAISVRDKNSISIVKELMSNHISVEYHLDPVFHYDYSNRIPKLRMNKRYIAVYAYSNMGEDILNAINIYARQNDMDIVCLQGYQGAYGEFINASPFEMIAYIKNANCVITNTFHGCVLAVKYQRSFAVHLQTTKTDGYSNEHKLGDLINRLGLEKNVFYDSRDLPEAMSAIVDYERINKMITEATKKGLDYLKQHSDV